MTEEKLVTKKKPTKKTPTEKILWMLKKYKKEVNIKTVEEYLSEMHMEPYSEIIQVMNLFDSFMKYKQVASYNDDDYDMKHRFVNFEGYSYYDALDSYNSTNIDLSAKFWLSFTQKLEKRFKLKHKTITRQKDFKFSEVKLNGKTVDEHGYAGFSTVDDKEYFFVWFKTNFCFPVKNRKQRELFTNIRIAIDSIFNSDCSRYLPDDFKL